MKYLLDSNIVIAASLATGDSLRHRLAACDEGDLVTSAIVYAEVVHGSEFGKPPFRRLEVFIEEVPVMAFGYSAARAYAALPVRRASYDPLIAAHMLSLGLTLITDNEKHLADVPGLKVENGTR